MLVPMLSVMVAGRDQIIQKLLRKIPSGFLYLATISGLLLIPNIRTYVAHLSVSVLLGLLSVTRSSTYYDSLLKKLLFYLGIFGVLIVLSKSYWERHIGRLAVLFTLILPSIFLLNNNFPIVPSFRYMFSPLPVKIVAGDIDTHNQAIFTLTNYIDAHISSTAPIIFLFRDNRAAFFIPNRERVRMPINAFRLSNLEEHLRSGDISTDYFVYTDDERDETLLQSVPTHAFATVGPYIIRAVDHAEK